MEPHQVSLLVAGGTTSHAPGIAVPSEPPIEPPSAAPQPKFLVEVFAGSARVTACLKHLGMRHAFGVDHQCPPWDSSCFACRLDPTRGPGSHAHMAGIASLPRHLCRTTLWHLQQSARNPTPAAQVLNHCGRPLTPMGSPSRPLVIKPVSSQLTSCMPSSPRSRLVATLPVASCALKTLGIAGTGKLPSSLRSPMCLNLQPTRPAPTVEICQR